MTRRERCGKAGAMRVVMWQGESRVGTIRLSRKRARVSAPKSSRRGTKRDIRASRSSDDCVLKCRAASRSIPTSSRTQQGESDTSDDVARREWRGKARAMQGDMARREWRGKVRVTRGDVARREWCGKARAMRVMTWQGESDARGRDKARGVARGYRAIIYSN